MPAKTKKIITFTIQLLTVLALSAGTIHLTTFAASALPTTGQSIFQSSNIPAPAPDQEGQKIVEDFVFGALRYVKIIIGVIGILYLSVLGYTLVTASDNEEEVTNARRGITYTLVAFVLISMSQDIGRIFDMKTGTLFGSPKEILNRVHIFDKQIEILVTFIKYLIAAYATAMILRSGIKLVTSGGDEEESTKHKKGILYSLGGLALIGIGDIAINKVFYKINKNVYSGITGVHPSIDAKAGVEQIKGITNLILSFVGPIAVLILIVGAVMYATAAGEQERMDRAKRLLIAAAVAIILIYGAFAIISTILGGRLQDLGALVE